MADIDLSGILKRIQELSTEEAVEIKLGDYTGINYPHSPAHSINFPGLSNQPHTWNSSSGTGNVTISAGAGLNYTSPYTFSSATPNWSIRDESKISSTIDLKGENADIKINGVSLVDTLKNIQDRLNILRPNPELETEWDQLRELGAQYRDLEKKLQEQSDMWAKLKAMPPPVID
jgi:hypothetical protein